MRDLRSATVAAMQKNLPAWAFGALSIIGVALAGSLVANWIFQISGLRLAWESNHWLFLVPVIGIALTAAAATRSPHTRLAAIAAGTAIIGYVLLDLASSMIHSGLDTWLILGGAAAMLAGASRTGTAWRLAGGVAVLVGVFAPWADASMWDVLTSGYSTHVLWLVPVAGALGIVSAGNAGSGGKLAAAAGATVYGVILWAIGSTAYLVYGLGAWAALGASAAALAIGVLAREPAPPAQQA